MWEKAILKCINLLSGRAHLQDIYRRIPEFLQLGPEDYVITPWGEERYHHEARAFLQRLKRFGDVENPDRGYWVITEQGRARIKHYEPSQLKTTLQDSKINESKTILPIVQSPQPTNGLASVAGMHELKKLLYRDIVKPFKNPEEREPYRIPFPTFLFYGPPGCGKTFIARKLAEELGCYFKETIPSDIASPYIHDTVRKIREIFDAAFKQAPSILFIDEFDAFVPTRDAFTQGHKSEEISEFLNQLNECAAKKIIVIGATNVPDKIDIAILRTGRFDKKVFVGPPDVDAIKEILRYHLSGRPQTDSLNIHIQTIAKALSNVGYSSSDIKFLVDEAAREAFERGKLPISKEIFLRFCPVFLPQ